ARPGKSSAARRCWKAISAPATGRAKPPTSWAQMLQEREKSMAHDWFPKRAIGTLPAYSASRWGRREALVYRQQRWSFSEFSDAVDLHARALLAAGIQPGERVALFMPNRPDFMLLFY